MEGWCSEVGAINIPPLMAIRICDDLGTFVKSLLGRAGGKAWDKVNGGISSDLRRSHCACPGAVYTEK